MSTRPEVLRTGDLRIREVSNGRSLRQFIELSWTINASDPSWVPPLRRSLAVALDRKRHPFHRHATVALFLAERSDAPVGRIAAILNRHHNEYHQDRTGFFGLFECRNDPEAAEALFTTAGEWLSRHGCDRVRGPLNFSTNEEVSSPGVLIDGFSTRPAIMMSHNPRYYSDLLEGAGFVKAKDLYAILLPDADRMPEWGIKREEAVLARHDAVIRSLDLRRFDREIAAIKSIYNAAWTRNWGFVPVTDEEFDFLAREFRPMVDPDLCLIAEVAGEPVGFSLAIPDLNQALRYLPDGRLFPLGLLKFLWYRRKIDALRLITFGFKPPFQQAGLGLGFYFRTWRTAAAKGYLSGEASWILEDNYKMIRPLEKLGGELHRTYRIYERRL